MTIEQIAFKVDELQLQAWELDSLALAVNDAITEGPHAASHFNGALSILTSAAYKLNKEMKAFSDELFESIRVSEKGIT